VACVQPVKGAANRDALPCQRAAGRAGAPGWRARGRARRLRGPCSPAIPLTARKVEQCRTPPPVENTYLGYE